MSSDNDQKSSSEHKGQPSLDQIISALEKSGYLFENKIAMKVEASDYIVDSSWAFKDPDEETSREIDVRATRMFLNDDLAKIQIISEILIECKNSDSPLVFLMTEKNSRERIHAAGSEYIFPIRPYRINLAGSSYIEVSGFKKFSLAEHHYYYRQAKKATQFAKVIRKSSDWHANHDGVYDSLILPLAKAFESRRKEVTTSRYRSGDWAQVRLFFNVVVLRDHLFSVDLNSEPLIPLATGRVSFLRHIRSGSLDGHYLIDFITEAYLPTYLAEIEDFCSKVAEVAGNKTNEFLGK